MNGKRQVLYSLPLKIGNLYLDQGAQPKRRRRFVHFNSWFNFFFLKSCFSFTNSRRLIISAWNPPEISKMILPPCHILMQ
ncbi:MAG: thymidylate synthase, partial [Candidatus Phytoplasma australasiaticum]|nr:thymidylate synthase [Candidatus Phytoplasma australasiaticum]